LPAQIQQGIFVVLTLIAESVKFCAGTRTGRTFCASLIGALGRQVAHPVSIGTKFAFVFAGETPSIAKLNAVARQIGFNMVIFC
jgi:hypothetical protein